jgi:hypothetical protein
MPRSLRPEGDLYYVIEHDVWGNARDGWEINDSRRTGECVVLSTSMNEKEIVQALKEEGIVRRDLRMNMIQIEWNDDRIEVSDSKGKPTFSLVIHTSHYT